MNQRLRYILSVLIGLNWSLLVSCSWAQGTITTETLKLTAVCPGSALDVTFTTDSPYGAGNAFTAELFDGTTYRTLPTGAASVVLTNRLSAIWRTSVTIPADVSANAGYQVRIKASNPAVVGSFSPSRLTVKAKPVAPTVPGEVKRCQPATGSPGDEAGWSVQVAAADADIRVYGSSGNALTLLSTSGSGLEKQVRVSLGDALPGTVTYFTTQLVNGCESDKAPLRVITQPKPASDITVDNLVGTEGGAVFGKISYCQGEKALPLNQKGHRPPGDSIRIEYRKESGDVDYEGYPPVPKTDKAGMIQFSLIPTLGGCPASLRPTAYVTVTVKPRPAKPAVAPVALTYCQNQTTRPLSATATADSLSLVWYGASLTGGTGASEATQPSSVSAGAFTYYVAQRAADCESERAALSVVVKAIATATLTGPPTIYEGQPVSLSVVFTGDGPWRFSYQDSSYATGVTGAVQTVETAVNPYLLPVNLSKTTAYRLTDVRNDCGSGALTGGVLVVNVAPLLGIEDQALADAVDVYPVPATTSLTVRIRGLSATQPARLELIDATGRFTGHYQTKQETLSLPLDAYPTGTYILRIQIGERTTSKRIVKL